MNRLLPLLLLFTSLSFSQDITLYEQLNGRYDYVAIGNTMNLEENGANGNCVIATDSAATLELSTDDTIIAAYLYWAGSDDGDFDVLLNNIPITADRTFADALDGNRTFFAAFADVSDQVISSSAIEYNLGELDVTDVIADYCPTGTNFAGWALVVVYENDNLPLNQLNIYDGLQSVPDELTITLTNLNVLDNEGARIGFVAWEGDRSLAVNESLRINGNIISNEPLNPANNAFNGTNSFTGSSELYNMDIDVYDLQDNISIGDDTAEISLTSGQDFVMINNIITVLNSQLPEATIVIDNVSSACQSQDIDLDYTVFNTNSTDVLPANTPIAFYIENVLIGQSQTQNIIPIGGNESNRITLNIPNTIEGEFIIEARVDDDGDGNSTVQESNETNNSDIQNYQLIQPNIMTQPNDLVDCSIDTTGSIAIFNLTINDAVVTGNQSNVSVTYHLSQTDADTGVNPILQASQFQNTTNPQTIYVRVEAEAIADCASVGQFIIEAASPPNTVNLEALESCDFDNNGSAEFNFSSQTQRILEVNPSAIINYYESMTNAENDENRISNTMTYENMSNPQDIFVRIESSQFENCFSIQGFALQSALCDIVIPTGISANGDGDNDTFNIPGLYEFYEDFSIKIYNRWGRLVYDGNQNIPAWDGFSNQPKIGNRNLPVGTYYYILKLEPEDPETHIGWVYLTR